MGKGLKNSKIIIHLVLGVSITKCNLKQEGHSENFWVASNNVTLMKQSFY